MTKAEFTAKYDECCSAFLSSLTDKESMVNHVKELTADNNHPSINDLFTAAVLFSLELNVALLRSVLSATLEFDD